MNILKKLFHNLFKNTKGIKILVDEAKSFEANKEYEEACYSYACAIGQGEDDEIIKDKVRYLFKNYGPFTFEKQLERMKKEYCSSCESCGEGYHIWTVKLINKITNKKDISN